MRGPTPTVNGVVPYWDTTGGNSLNAGYPTNPGLGTITTLVGLDGSNRLPAVSGALLTGIPSGLIRSYIAGMQLSNDGVTPNTILDISAGVCADSTQAVMINSPTAFKKTTGGAWTSGTGNAGMGLGLTVAINTTYHVFAINNGGNPDFYFDTSAAGANAPVGTTAFRRVGSMRTAGGTTNILAFVQDGDGFQWGTGTLDVSASPGTTAAVTRALTVPNGIRVQAIVNAWIAYTIDAAAGVGLITDLLCADVLPTFSGFNIGGAAALNVANTLVNMPSVIRVFTNTSAQVRSRISTAAGGATLNIYTLGWVDRRGQDA